MRLGKLPVDKILELISQGELESVQEQAASTLSQYLKEKRRKEYDDRSKLAKASLAEYAGQGRGMVDTNDAVAKLAELEGIRHRSPELFNEI